MIFGGGGGGGGGELDIPASDMLPFVIFSSTSS